MMQDDDDDDDDDDDGDDAVWQHHSLLTYPDLATQHNVKVQISGSPSISGAVIRGHWLQFLHPIY